MNLNLKLRLFHRQLCGHSCRSTHWCNENQHQALKGSSGFADAHDELIPCVVVIERDANFGTATYSDTNPSTWHTANRYVVLELTQGITTDHDVAPSREGRGPAQCSFVAI